MDKTSKIFVAGHTGLVGSALLRSLTKQGFSNLVIKKHDELDLTNQQATLSFFEKERPEYVFLSAAKVGGIIANNSYKAEFIYTNTQIQTNVIHSSYLVGVKKLLFLGSSCIYPKNVNLPIKEESLLTGELEQTNAPNAIAKTLGVKMCEYYYQQYGCNYLSVMPCNLFGENDNYDFETSHVIASLIRKIYLAKCLEDDKWNFIQRNLSEHTLLNFHGENTRSELEQYLSKLGIEKKENGVQITLFGNGESSREFLHSDDLAEICIKIMMNINAKSLFDKYNLLHINIGAGYVMKIKELAEAIKTIAHFNGSFLYNNQLIGFDKRFLSLDKLNELIDYKSVNANKRIDEVYKAYEIFFQK